MVDIVEKKNELKEKLADMPANVSDTRTEVVNLVQLGEEMRTQLCWAVTTNNLPYHCEKLAKQRAVLQGKTFASSSVINFTFANSTSGTPNWGTSAATLTLPKLEDSSNTSFGVQALLSSNNDVEITLSGTSGATQTIDSNDYSVYIGDYFFARSRSNGELIESSNNDPYTGPSLIAPFLPANTINGETYFGDATDPTANSDYRYDYVLLTNSTSTGHAGGGKDIGETKYLGNTFVILSVKEVDGTFSTNETLKDSEGSSAIIKSSTNTASVSLELIPVNGTFSVGETVQQTTSEVTSNAVIDSILSTVNTEARLEVNSLLTGANSDFSLGFSTSNVVTLGDGAVTRIGTVATAVFANGHGITSGDVVIMAGANTGSEEFAGAFNVIDSNTTHFSYETGISNTGIANGSFTFSKELVVGLTSGAVGTLNSRTINNTSNVILQTINAASNTNDTAGFTVGNVVTGSTSSTTGKIDERFVNGAWYSTYSNTVKTYDSTNGSWAYDETNNPNGIATAANTVDLDWWLKNTEAANIHSFTASGVTDGSLVDKVHLTIPLATSSDASGGYDSTVRTFPPMINGRYPIKSWNDQTTSANVVFLEAYENFADVIITVEGTEKNVNWLPLGNNVSGDTSGGDIAITGAVGNTAHVPENTTVANSSIWQGDLGIYNKAYSGNDDIVKSSNPEYRSTGSNSSYSNTSTADTMYGNIERNPLYPATAGTQKAYTNTADQITGTQPYGYGEEDIYAGQFFAYEGGRKFVSSDGNDIPEDDYSYRYGVWADQKWSLGVDPEQTVILPVSTGTGVPGSGPSLVNGGRTGPPANRFKETFVENTSTLTALSDAGSNFNSGTGGTFTLNGSTTSGTYRLAIPASTGPSSPHDFGTSYSETGAATDTPTSGNWSQIGASGEGQGLTIYQLASSFLVPAENISGSSAAVTYPNIVVSRTYTASVSTTAVDGGESSPSTYTHVFSWVAGAQTYYPCAYNEFEKFWRQDGSSSGASTDAQVTYLDTKLSDLNSNPVDDPFEDGLTSAGNAPIITDAAFDTAVDGLISTIAAAKSAHDSFSPSSGTAGGQSIVTGTYNAHSQFKTYWEDLYVFLNTELPNRIAEITARIGYLDKMPPSSGGDSKLTAKSYTTSGGPATFSTLTAPDSNFYSNPALSATTGGGWQGYAFKDTNGSGTVRYGGYMSQVFAAVNVMAGKKIGFVKKIIDAIDNIDSLYTLIKKKRAEYYEYHQANSTT